MTREQASFIEEVFVEKNFELGDDPDTIAANLNVARVLYENSLKQAEGFADDIECGVMFDTPSAVFAIQNLVFAKKYMEQFEKELTQCNV